MRAGRRLGRALLGAAALSWLIVEGVAAQEMYRLRGTIESADAQGLVIDTRDGEVLGLPFKEDAGVFVVRPATLEEIKAGDFVGMTSIETDEGRRVALEAHVFAEDLRGVGEGHYPWDLVSQPNMMTNATVAEVKEVGRERELRVTWAEAEGGARAEETIVLPPEAPVVHLEAAPDRSVLAPGKEVFVMVEGNEEGFPEITVAVVGEEGATPPM